LRRFLSGRVRQYDAPGTGGFFFQPAHDNPIV